MGAAIAARLAEVGYQVSGWNRSAEKAKPRPRKRPLRRRQRAD